VQEQPINDHSMTEYLLGASSAKETERLDEMSLADSEFADRLRVVEDDLVDAYIQGELPRDLLQRFTSYYLATPLRREKVHVAMTFLTFADTAAAPAEQTAAQSIPKSAKAFPSEVSRRGFFDIPRLALQWGFAAAGILLLVAGGYLAYQNLRLRNQIAQTQAERTALEQSEEALKRELDAQRSVDIAKQQELAQVRERLAQLEQQQPADQSREPRTVAFNLSPQTRGAGEGTTITVPAGIDSVSLKLEVEATGFPAYQLALRDSASRQISWRSGRLRVIGGALRVTVPARLLRSQNYLLELSGISPAGSAENVGNYPFKVARP
jgi:flagellar motility protein MotE (MotC chaperone)